MRAPIFVCLFLFMFSVVTVAGCEVPSGSVRPTTSDAADPNVIWDGTRYVLQTTNTQYGNVPTWTSTDLRTWTWGR